MLKATLSSGRRREAGLTGSSQFGYTIGIMAPQVQITYRGTEPSEALNRLIHEEVEKLGKFFDGVVGCRVLIEHEHQRSGSPFHVGITIAVPGTELAAGVPTGDELDATHKDPARTIRDAFRRAKRRLHDYAERKAPQHVRPSLE